MNNHPIYTEAFKNISLVYVKNGDIIKNRFNVERIETEVNNLNNVILEEGNDIYIYCKDQHMVKRYQDIKYRFSSDTQEHIWIISDFPKIAKYVRWGNRVYSIVDFQDKEIIEFKSRMDRNSERGKGKSYYVSPRKSWWSEIVWFYELRPVIHEYVNK